MLQLSIAAKEEQISKKEAEAQAQDLKMLEAEQKKAGKVAETIMMEAEQNARTHITAAQIRETTLQKYRENMAAEQKKLKEQTENKFTGHVKKPEVDEKAMRKRLMDRIRLEKLVMNSRAWKAQQT